MATGTMKIRVVGDASKFSRAMDKAQGKLGKLGSAAAKVGKFAAAGVAAAGAAAVGAAFKTASFGDEIAKTSTKLGVTTDALQEMRVWADRNGISSQSLDRAVGRLNQRIGRAAEGNEKYADAFKAVDVAIHDAEGNMRSTNDVMADTIKALSDIEDPALQSARASEIFGTKMARDLMPALQDGSLSLADAAELAHELGIVMDKDALAAAERFTDGWANLKQGAMGFLHQAGTPVMAFMADKLFPAIQDKVLPALQRLGAALKGLFDLVVRGDFTSGLGKALGVSEDSPIVDGLFQLRETALATFNAISEWWDANGPKIIAAVREFGSRAAEAFQAVASWVTDTLIPAVGRLADWWDANGPTIIGHVKDVWATLQDLSKIVGQVVKTVTDWLKRFGDSSSEQTKAAGVAFERARDIISSAIDAAVAIFRFFVATSEAIWRTWGATILRFLAETWEAVKRIIDGALNIVEGIFETFAGLFTGDWSRMWDGIKQILSGVWEAIRGIFDTAFGLIRGALSVFRVAVTSVWSDLWEAAKRTVSSAFDAVVEWVTDLPERLVEALQSAWAAYQTYWQSVFTDGKNFASDRFDDVVGFVTDLPGKMKAGLASKWETFFGHWKRIFIAVKRAVKSRIDDVVQWFKELPGRIVSALGNLGSKIASKFSFKLPGVSFSGQGDGPGRDVPNVGGSAAKRVQAVLGQFPGARVTSTYRTPAENRRVGGSPTSFHLDRDNPAVDIGGPTAVLDQVAAMLQQMGGWREFLWRTKGHYDHIHVAHTGGVVTDRGIAPLPDELDVRVKRGETILPPGATVGSDGGDLVGVLRSLDRTLAAIERNTGQSTDETRELRQDVADTRAEIRRQADRNLMMGRTR